MLEQKKNNSSFWILVVIILLILSLNYKKIGMEIGVSSAKDGSEFNGQIMYRNKLNKNKVVVTVPYDYEDQGGSGNYFIVKKSTLEGNSNFCAVYINNTNYKNLENFVPKAEQVYSGQARKININGDHWYYIETKNTSEKKLYTEYNKEILEIILKGSSDTCKEGFTKILNSVTLK